MNRRRILLTGCSSFTGYWFARELINLGFELCCPLPHEYDEYLGVKKQRLDFIRDKATLVFKCPFGTNGFIELCKNHYYGMGFHGFYMENYNNRNYKISSSLSQNLKNIETILEILQENRTRIIYSSSIFEDAINIEDDNNESTSIDWYNYAFSKKVTFLALRSLCEQYGLTCQRFVITNPFGPYEDTKFCFHLMNSILKKNDFLIKTPFYTRDMIQVDLLAKLYANAFLDLNGENLVEFRPSQYSMKIFEFAELFISEISKYCGYKISIIKGNQKTFNEPEILINDINYGKYNCFYETKEFWNDYFYYYRNNLSKNGCH